MLYRHVSRAFCWRRWQNVNVSRCSKTTSKNQQFSISFLHSWTLADSDINISSTNKFDLNGRLLHCLAIDTATAGEIDPRMMATTKIDSPEFHQLFTPELRHVADMFKKRQYEIRIAGGCVRDMLMGIAPGDIDLATTATPDQMHQMFKEEGVRTFNVKGESHGTVSCRVNDKENFEITTLRVDILCHGRRADVEFTTDWMQDANRRDLTINSLFLGFDGTVYDFFGGIEDLQRRRIAFVGDADTRIKEDFLRILRYFRFYGRLARDPDSHEPDTIEAIKKNKEGLKIISVERIWMEFRKILVGRFGDLVVKRMLDIGLRDYLKLPECANVPEFEKVYKRAYPLEPLAMTMVAAMLETEDQVYETCAALKTSNNERLVAVFNVQNRDNPLLADPDSDAARKFLQDCFLDQGGLHTPYARVNVVELAKYLGHRELAEHLQSWDPPRIPVDGVAVILEGGVGKGPKVKLVLTRLHNAWKASNYQLSKVELLAKIPKILEELEIDILEKQEIEIMNLDKKEKV